MLGAIVVLFKVFGSLNVGDIQVFVGVILALLRGKSLKKFVNVINDMVCMLVVFVL